MHGTPLWNPWANTCGRKRRMNSWAGRVMVFPTLVCRVLIAEAHLVILDGEQAVVGQRDPVDIPAEVRQDWLGVLHGRFAIDHPPCGPDRLRQGQVRAFLTHQIQKASAKALRKGMDGDKGGRAGGPPRGPVSGDPTRWHQAVDVRMVGQRAGPGVQHT